MEDPCYYQHYLLVVLEIAAARELLIVTARVFHMPYSYMTSSSHVGQQSVTQGRSCRPYPTDKAPQSVCQRIGCTIAPELAGGQRSGHYHSVHDVVGNPKESREWFRSFGLRPA